QKALYAQVKVTDADISAYYVKHKSDYQQPQSREVRHILVKKKSLADKIYSDLKSGADFAKLARRYSQDTASKASGGKFTAYKGKTVAPFDNFVFAAKTGELSKPIKTSFRCHAIQVLSDVKPESPTPLATVQPTSRSTPRQQRPKQ